MANKIPKDERVWVSYRSSDGTVRFLLTSKPARDMYYLYEADGDGPRKLGKSPSPKELEEKYAILESISEKEKR